LEAARTPRADLFGGNDCNIREESFVVEDPIGYSEKAILATSRGNSDLVAKKAHSDKRSDCRAQIAWDVRFLVEG